MLHEFIMPRLFRLIFVLTLLIGAAVLQGCGTLNATVKDKQGRDVMLLGHDPVAYHTLGKAMRGYPDKAETYEGKTYYFLNDQHRATFRESPARYEPQYGGFCSNGAPYALKLGSDPTEFEIVDGRLFIFGDILGHELWKLDYRENIKAADVHWPRIRERGWRGQTLFGWIFRVERYNTGAGLREQWSRKFPDKPLVYDTGGRWRNLVTKYPGWRAREGYGQPALGLPGEDGAPPGTESKGYVAPWTRPLMD